MTEPIYVDMSPQYAQVITTWLDPEYMDVEQRNSIIVSCADSVYEMLSPRPELVIVADDGSRPDLFPSLASYFLKQVFLPRVDDSRGVGDSLNRGFRFARAMGHEFVLYAVDDWEAMMPLDLRAPLAYLAADKSVAAIRLGLPHPDLTGTIKHTPHGWYIDLDPHHYVVSHRPTLWRIDAVEWLGWWPENVSAVECEATMNRRWLEREAPHRRQEIRKSRMLYWLPTTFDHIESVSLSEIDPKARTR